MRPVYLDNNATTRADPAVVAAMLPFFSDQFGNASSSHAFGSEVAGALRQARKHLQALLGAAFDHEIVFTSGGTESDNAAILSALETQSGRDEIVTTAVEHPAILSLVEYLRDRRGITVHLIGVDTAGSLDLEAYKHALSPRTAIASVMWANNETGTLFPISELAQLAHACGALFHTDAVQAVGKQPIDLKAAGVDMLSLSGHKLHGPKGIGALYVRKGTPFAPLVRGGPQERRRRGGTENVPAIVGLGKAAELAATHLADEQTRVRALRDHLEQGIIETIGHCAVLGDLDHRLPNTSNIAFQHLEGEPIVMRLNQAGIAASLGSACASGSMEPSHVLRAMNVPPDLLRGAVRFSLSRDNTIDDVERVLHVLPEIIGRLRETSPSWQQHRSSQSADALRPTEFTQ
ncbi:MULTISPECIES: cysteine desulfurase NifS [unclassified Bradyrhizobium]|uniref:cysteine desulfurase NifS n=1 Tax=unclassified Bradyrhizobium TaxID=2631580 RepID=UPI00291674BE|nr:MULTISPECIES: cysteine desulfurase NifS [unclassified Bradyrhizobium]